jgi:hypothetical protein
MWTCFYKGERHGIRIFRSRRRDYGAVFRSVDFSNPRRNNQMSRKDSCLELDRDGKFRYARGQCAVLFRISLPVGKKELFESITGFNLTVPPKIGIN